MSASPQCRGVWWLAWLKSLSSRGTAEQLGCCTWCWQRWSCTRVDWKMPSAVRKKKKGWERTRESKRWVKIRHWDVCSYCAFRDSPRWHSLPLAYISAETRTSWNPVRWICVTQDYRDLKGVWNSISWQIYAFIWHKCAVQISFHLPDKGQVHPERPVCPRAIYAHKDAIGDAGPAGIFCRAVKANLKGNNNTQVKHDLKKK